MVRALKCSLLWNGCVRTEFGDSRQLRIPIACPGNFDERLKAIRLFSPERRDTITELIHRSLSRLTWRTRLDPNGFRHPRDGVSQRQPALKLRSPFFRERHAVFGRKLKTLAAFVRGVRRSGLHAVTVITNLIVGADEEHQSTSPA